VRLFRRRRVPAPHLLTVEDIVAADFPLPKLTGYLAQAVEDVLASLRGFSDEDLIRVFRSGAYRASIERDHAIATGEHVRATAALLLAFSAGNEIPVREYLDRNADLLADEAWAIQQRNNAERFRLNVTSTIFRTETT